MSELGQILKAAREQKGLTLEDIQEQTKIQKRYIDAIEQGRFELLPGPFYTRAFIKSIAETLGLDADQLIREYAHTLPKDETEILEAGLQRRRQRTYSQSFSIGQWLSRLLVVAFVVLILFIIYYFIVENTPATDQAQQLSPSIEQNRQNEMNQNPTQSQTPAPSQEPSADADKETETPPQAESPAEQPQLAFVREEGKTAYYQLRNAQKVEVVLRAEGSDVWYQIRKGRRGALLDDATLKNGTEKTLTFEGVETLYLHFGATRFMKLTINGQPVDLSQKPDSYKIEVSIESNPS